MQSTATGDNRVAEQQSWGQQRDTGSFTSDEGTWTIMTDIKSTIQFAPDINSTLSRFSIPHQHHNGPGDEDRYRHRSVPQINWRVICIFARQEIKNSGANDGSTTVVQPGEEAGAQPPDGPIEPCPHISSGRGRLCRSSVGRWRLPQWRIGRTPGFTSSAGGVGKRQTGVRCDEWHTPEPEEGPVRRPFHPEEVSAYRDYNLNAQVRREVRDTRVPAMTKVTYGSETDVIPRAYGWIRTHQDWARPVTILFDSRTSHNFIHPRVVRELGLFPESRQGPTNLKVVDDRVIPCDGAVVNVEIMTSTIKGGSSYIERVTLCTTDIGADDINLGDPSLKSHEGGYGSLETNTWRMVKDGITYLIPLMTADGDHAKVIETVKGAKKIKWISLVRVDKLFFLDRVRKRTLFP